MSNPVDFNLESFVGGDIQPMASPQRTAPSLRYPVSSLETPTGTQTSIFPNLTRQFSPSATSTPVSDGSDRLLDFVSSPITVTPQDLMASSVVSSRTSLSPTRPRSGNMQDFKSFVSTSPRTNRSTSEVDRFVDLINTPISSSSSFSTPQIVAPRRRSGGVLFTENNTLVPLAPSKPTRTRSYMSRRTPMTNSSTRRQLFSPRSTTVSNQSEIDRFRNSLTKKEDSISPCTSCTTAKDQILSRYGQNLNMETPLSNSRRPQVARTLSPTRRSLTASKIVPGRSSLVEDKGIRTFMSIYNGDIVEYQGRVGERYEKNGIETYYIDGKPVSKNDFISHGGWTY